MVPTATKRLWLRRAYSRVTAGTYASLLLALEAQAYQAGDAIASGTIASSSINGHAVSFSNRDNGATPEDVASAWEELLTLREQAYAALGGAPNDAAVYAEMLFRLEPVRSFTKDYAVGQSERFA